MLTLLSLALLSQTGVCKAGQNCQVNNLQAAGGTRLTGNVPAMSLGAASNTNNFFPSQTRLVIGDGGTTTNAMCIGYDSTGDGGLVCWGLIRAFGSNRRFDIGNVNNGTLADGGGAGPQTVNVFIDPIVTTPTSTPSFAVGNTQSLGKGKAMFYTQLVAYADLIVDGGIQLGNGLLVPTLTNEQNFPATAASTRGGLIVGADGGTRLYISPGDGGAWNEVGGTTALLSSNNTWTGVQTYTNASQLNRSDLGNYLNQSYPVTQAAQNYVTEYASNFDITNSPSLWVAAIGNTGWVTNSFAGNFIGSTRRGSGTTQPFYLFAKDLPGPGFAEADMSLKIFPNTGVVTTIGNDLEAAGLRTIVVHGTGTAAQALEYGSGAMTAGALAVTFSTAFGAAPVCVCNHVKAVPLACGPTSVASATTVTFAVATGGTDTVNYSCAGPR